jgi:hypothetical protein
MTKENFPGKVVSVQARVVGDNKLIYDVALSNAKVYATFDEDIQTKAADLALMVTQPDSLFKTTSKKVPKKDGDGFWENHYLDAIEDLEPFDAAKAEGLPANVTQTTQPVNRYKEDPEKTARIARQNATSTAFNFVGMLHAASIQAGNDYSFEVVKEHALEVAREIYAITMQEVPSANGQAVKSELPTW